MDIFFFGLVVLVLLDILVLFIDFGGVLWLVEGFVLFWLFRDLEEVVLVLFGGFVVVFLVLRESFFIVGLLEDGFVVVVGGFFSVFFEDKFLVL